MNELRKSSRWTDRHGWANAWMGKQANTHACHKTLPIISMVDVGLNL